MTLKKLRSFYFTHYVILNVILYAFYELNGGNW